MLQMLGKYSLYNLYGQSMQSHFLTLSLNGTSELICLKFWGKTDHNCGDLQFQVSIPIFTVLFLFVANFWKFLGLCVLFFLSNIKSIIGAFRLFYKSQPSEFGCFYGDYKYHYSFVTAYQSHLYGHLVLIW